MARLVLLPRLSAAGVVRVLADADGKAPRPLSLDEARASYGSMISFGASGGSRSVTEPAAIAEEVREVAAHCGFPQGGGRDARSRFDTQVGIALAERESLTTGEGLRDDVWAFITTILVPDVVAWRFPDINRDRFRGGVRNALQRCWTRAIGLDRGKGHTDRWGLLAALNEDALVQIFERPTLACDPSVTREIGEVAARLMNAGCAIPSEAAVRKAMKRLRVAREILELSRGHHGRIRHIVQSEFDRASVRASGTT